MAKIYLQKKNVDGLRVVPSEAEAVKLEFDGWRRVDAKRAAAPQQAGAKAPEQK
jgi:hypothetical protein